MFSSIHSEKTKPKKTRTIFSFLSETLLLDMVCSSFLSMKIASVVHVFKVLKAESLVPKEFDSQKKLVTFFRTTLPKVLVSQLMKFWYLFHIFI